MIDYLLEGTQIIGEQHDDGTLIIYLYDDTGVSGMVIKSGTTEYFYFFEKNLQGDIIAIYNESLVKIVDYTYDAWGNFTTTVTSSASSWEYLVAEYYNPFRYRGYYWDFETGNYYLQTRYYNPEWGRFISSDAIAYLGVGDELLSYNLFAYCANNPVMGYDPYGTWDWNLIGKIALTTLAVAGALVFASTFGTAAVVIAGITIACSAIDGGICAEESGGDFWEGFMAGAIGGSVSAIINAPFSVGNIPADVGLRAGVGARAVGTITYDLTYEWFSTGTLSQEGIATCIVDTTLDVLYSTIIYGNNSLSNQVVSTLVNCVADSAVDVFQTKHLLNGEVPEWARAQKQGGK